jgi:DNA repair protein RadD
LILRDYQKQALDAIWTKINLGPTALCVLPTGSGKSVIFEALIQKSISLKPDIKILVLFNKTDLLMQIKNRIAALIGEDLVTVYSGTFKSYDNTKSVTCGMIQSLKMEDINYNLIIVDECHNLNEKSGKYINFLKAQQAQNPKTKVVGFTATPYRNSGYLYGKDKFFDRPCFQKTMRFMIEEGHLVPPIAKRPDHLMDLSDLKIVAGEYSQGSLDKMVKKENESGVLVSRIDDALARMKDRKKIVWFCTNIAHCESVHELLLEKNEKSSILHSNLEKDEREENKTFFEDQGGRHLVFVSIVSEGYDFPAIDCVVLMRPTRSPNLMVQTCGRGLRPYKDKEDCLILDYGKVIQTIGPLDDPVIQVKGQGKKKGEVSKTKVCPECQTILHVKEEKCSVCFYNFVKEPELDQKAKENIDFFRKQIKTLKIAEVKIRKHISKAGNSCIAIRYTPGLFTMFESIEEYFVFESQHGYVRFQQRAIELGIPLAGTIDEQVTKKPVRIPQEVEYEFEGKYPKIKRLIFGEKALR